MLPKSLGILRTVVYSYWVVAGLKRGQAARADDDPSPRLEELRPRGQVYV